MTPTQTGLAYDGITARWTDGQFDMQNGITQHSLALQFAHQSGYALDVGCGCTGRIASLLIHHGYAVEGIDVSAKMLALAKASQPEVHYHHGDICTIALSTKYDFITAWDSLWHVPLEQQYALISKLADSLAPGGVLIFSFGGTDKADEHYNAAMGPELYYASLGINGYVRCVIASDCLIRHVALNQPLDKHCYLIAVKRGGDKIREYTDKAC